MANHSNIIAARTMNSAKRKKVMTLEDDTAPPKSEGV